MYKSQNFILIIIGIIFILSFFVYAEEIKQGDKIVIIEPGTVARLCPYPNCGENQHITRIPEGTILVVEGIMNIKETSWTVQWFEVIYNGQRGWISIYNTNKQ